MLHVLLCGGSGTRLWPLSNKQTPKQLLPLFDGQSLLQLTWVRNSTFCDSVMAVVNEQQSEMVSKQLGEAGAQHVQMMEEPVGRNTAAAIALAAFSATPETILLITPADHLIGTPDLYAETIKKAAELAAEGHLVTIGLQPAYPETGYGYIQYTGYDVVRFTEKPNKVTAEAMLKSGDYLWNSGIFCGKAGVLLQQLLEHAPEIYAAASEAALIWKETGTIPLAAMEAIPSDSIDYAVLEKSNIVKVVPSAMQWSDVGGYEALAEALASHYRYSNHQAVFIESDPVNSMVIGKDKLVALVGVENVVVVNTPEVLLILQKGKGQEVKQLHQWVKENRPELL
ncbi:mannose-1-phosphate guanylyltransferase [Chitinophaga filiformis]|uniref:mannose-1-phosphate guanylyltransferase n=1 Tax=Chitinophaga filiformis TaxID=104663 RepID=UPI001F24042A|nr:mannose-1-phosphate guanylyltransferase [Chitinophaga filiformis]MCF6402769.1 mannose-1-phosphate guanylyltransferase [Chitinophaga filiformis]MCF6403313.1 mannose-1-phosphate guanylyltransferase [Chitinophaga filiformis]